MNRDFGRLEKGPFDLLIIGGGIYGAWIAFDATLRGLRVAMVEKRDWASATSSASSKLIHGGLRYLEQYRFGLVRKTLAERKLLLRLAPHRVRALRFVVPLYGDARVAPWRLEAGLWIYDRLGGRRRRMPRYRRYDRRSLLRRWEFLEANGLKCGFTYPDGGMDDARFVVELVDGAVEEGAVAVNRARAEELLLEGGAVVGARIVDEEDGGSLEVRAGVTLNCAGPWSQSLVHKSVPDVPGFSRLAKGIHLVLPPLPSDDAFLLLSRRHGGVVFLIPWYGRTLVGTTDTDFEGDPEQVVANGDDAAYLLQLANRSLAGAPWSETDVLASFAGLRTLPASPGSSSSSVSRELAIEEPIPKLITPVGGKYTSARADAAIIVDRTLDCLGSYRGPTRTDKTPLPWRPSGSYRRWASEIMARGLEWGLPESALLSWQRRYGTRIERLFELVAERPELIEPIEPGLPFTLAEAVYAVREEMARDLEDVLRRRIPLLLLSRPTQVALFQVADVIGTELGWTEERKHDEVAAVFRGPGNTL